MPTVKTKAARKPKYGHHAPSGRGCIYVNRKIVYLQGAYNSAESWADYDKRCRELAGLRDTPDVFHLAVDHIVEKFMAHARVYYRKHGKETSEVNCHQQAFRPLLQLYADLRARDFGPQELKAVRELMIEWGLVRKSINRHVGRIRRAFEWAYEEGMIPVETATGLQLVKALKPGRTLAKDNPKVVGVSQEAIDAVKPFVTRQVWAMIQVQLHSAMRPGEVCRMRRCDIKMVGKKWEYTPPVHKTEHHDVIRVVALGAKAQAIIREYLKPDLTAPLFDPREARAEFVAKKYRKGAKASRRKTAPDHYTLAGYECSIRRACEKAFGMPDHLRKIDPKLDRVQQADLKQQAQAWRKMYCWHPHQLRHTAATRIREKFDAMGLDGLAMAAAAMGHQQETTAETYARRQTAKAHLAMEHAG